MALFLFLNLVMMKKIVLMLLLILGGWQLISAKQYAVLLDTCNVNQSEAISQKVSFLPVVLVGKIITLPDSVLLKIPDNNEVILSLNDSALFNKELINYFVKNIVYPNSLIDSGVEDRFELQLKLDKDGVLEQIDVLLGKVEEMKKEINRVAIQLFKKKLVTPNKDYLPTRIHIPISFKVIRISST